MNEDFDVTQEMLRIRPEMAADGYKVGDSVKGKVLHANYSRYMQKVAAEDPELVQQMAEEAVALLTTRPLLQPVLCLSLANNASNGIEPSFLHHYHVMSLERKKSKEKVDVYSFNCWHIEQWSPNAQPGSDNPEHQL